MQSDVVAFALRGSRLLCFGSLIKPGDDHSKLLFANLFQFGNGLFGFERVHDHCCQEISSSVPFGAQYSLIVFVGSFQLAFRSGFSGMAKE